MRQPDDGGVLPLRCDVRSDDQGVTNTVCLGSPVKVALQMS